MIDHTAFVDRPFGDVAEIIERHYALMLADATNAAGRRSSALMDDGDLQVGEFDPRESLAVVVEEGPVPTANHVWIEFGWRADREKRLLANVRARLDVSPLVRSGRGKTTELRLRAEYDPPAGSRHSPEAILFGRRVVRAALHELLEEIVRFLEDYEETLEMRIALPGSAQRSSGG